MHVRDWGPFGTLVPPPNPEEITSSNNNWTSEVQIFGASTQWALEKTDAYFKNVHGRNAYDDASGNLNVFINAIYANANDTMTNTGNATY